MTSKLISQNLFKISALFPLSELFRVRRFFQGKFFDGTIVGYVPDDDVEPVPIWKIEHDDGDFEELEKEEVQFAMDDFINKVTEPPRFRPPPLELLEGRSSEQESESNFSGDIKVGEILLVRNENENYDHGIVQVTGIDILNKDTIHVRWFLRGEEAISCPQEEVFFSMLSGKFQEELWWVESQYAYVYAVELVIAWKLYYDKERKVMTHL